MKNLLTPEHRGLLAKLARSRLLVAFDFDGTLAPIVAQRSAAHMRRPTRAALSRVCTLYPCAVISGRARDDLRARLGQLPVRHLIGNHGLEPGPHLDEFAAEMARARELLADAVARYQGVEIEDKRYSLALHYRKSRRKREARAGLLAAISELPMPLRIVPGKLVLNLVPARAPNKGDAVLALSAAEAADAVLYVGDDVTDEDVFELDQGDHVLGVRVGESTTSAARYFVRDQRAVDRLLTALAELREPRHAHPS